MSLYVPVLFTNIHREKQRFEYVCTPRLFSFSLVVVVVALVPVAIGAADGAADAAATDILFTIINIHIARVQYI